MLANRLLSLGNVSTSSISMERLTYSNSNAKLIEAVFERRIMIDGFLVAYITILSLSAQSLQYISVLVSSSMGEEYRL